MKKELSLLCVVLFASIFVFVQAFDPSICIGYCQDPTNAAKVFRWGTSKWEQEWFGIDIVGDPGSNWQTNVDRSMIEQRGGMMGLIADSQNRNLTVWATDTNARYGRWEARVRAKTTGSDTTGQPYQFFWELSAVPDQTCGAQNIIIASFHIADDRVRGAVYNGAKAFQFQQTLDLQNKAWHTYAVEITKDRISWFADTKVLRTELRSAALSGVMYRPQFRIIGQSGVMQPSRLEMDWVRYYDLSRPNALPVTAPRMKEIDYTPSSCSASVARAETSGSSSSSSLRVIVPVVVVSVVVVVAVAAVLIALVLIRRKEKTQTAVTTDEVSHSLMDS